MIYAITNGNPRQRGSKWFVEHDGKRQVFDNSIDAFRYVLRLERQGYGPADSTQEGNRVKLRVQAHKALGRSQRKLGRDTTKLRRE